MQRRFRSPPKNLIAALFLGWALVLTGWKVLRQNHQIIMQKGGCDDS